jgi:hypothetical protein
MATAPPTREPGGGTVKTRMDTAILISFKLFGHDVATLSLHLPTSEDGEQTVVDKGTKAVSRWWVRHMVK